MAEERLAAEKRRQAAEESRAHRQKVVDEAGADENEDTAVLDNLLEKLRTGDTVGRKARRTRPATAARHPVPLSLDPEVLLAGEETGNETVDIAKDMLARLQSDGFSTQVPRTFSVPSASQRRSRRRIDKGSVDLIAGELEGLVGVQDPPERGSKDASSAAEDVTLVGPAQDAESLSDVP